MATPVITFSFATWIGLYPEFAAVNQVQASGWFDRAGFICGNEPCNVLNSVPGMLQCALYLLTSHLAWLNAPRDAKGNPAASGTPPPPIVGRINTASEGSVSVGATIGDETAGSPSQPWYMQTRYGAEYWNLTAPVRTARYVAHPTRVPGPIYPGFRRGFY